MKETFNAGSNQWAKLITIGVVGSFVIGWIVQFLWNSCLVPAVNGINHISYWQSVGLFFLFSILLKPSSLKQNK